jgi:hypothetical protein
VEGHVRRGLDGLVTRVELDRLRETRRVEQRVVYDDLGARVKAPRHPHGAATQLTAMHPLERLLQLVDARRPQDDARAERDELPPVLQNGSALRVHGGPPKMLSSRANLTGDELECQGKGAICRENAFVFY